MSRAPRLTDRQRAMLDILPDPPSDGLRIKGRRLATARSLCTADLARRIAAVRDGEGGYYVRTPSGKAEATAFTAEQGGVMAKCIHCGARHSLELDSDLIDEDPPADIDEQLRDALIGAAERTLLELTRASGEAQRYRHSIETIAQMLEDDADVAVYIAEVLRA